MREKGWSRVRLFEEVGAELGYSPKSRSAFLPLLVDKQPSAREAAILIKHFGTPEERPEPEPQPDLAAAVLALATELRAWREERESIEERLRAAESELQSLRARPAAEASPGRSAPPSTAGSGR
jgi:hypothetical protein